jgi:hypothetical protein
MPSDPHAVPLQTSATFFVEFQRNAPAFADAQLMAVEFDGSWGAPPVNWTEPSAARIFIANIPPALIGRLMPDALSIPLLAKAMPDEVARAITAIEIRALLFLRNCVAPLIRVRSCGKFYTRVC